MKLIVNADDLGLSAGVNRGIAQAHENGIVTSASFMTRWPGAKEAADYAKATPTLGVGLHVDLGEWAFRNDQWEYVYSVVEFEDLAAVEKEVRQQLAAFLEMLGRKPTHIDSHQHVHKREPARAILTRIAAEIGVPLRHFEPRVAYVGSFYGQDEFGGPYHQAIKPEALAGYVQSMSNPITELACHPGFCRELDTMYRIEREIEIASLCDPMVRQAIADKGIQLIHFGQIGAGGHG